MRLIRAPRLRLPRSERLRDELGVPRRVVPLPSSPRSRVWRVELGSAPAVIKQVVGGTDAPMRYQREVTALAIAGQVSPPVAPGVLGLDAGACLMVLEYLPHQRPGPRWVLDWARALARLHTATGLRGSLPARPAPSWHDADSFLGFARSLQVSVPSGVQAELAALLVRLVPSDPKVLLHGDPCPGNDLHTEGGVRFIDFEQACLGSGATELAYLRIGFPTCWCVTTVGAELLAEAESAYREQWGTGGAGQAAPADVADACAGWLICGDALVESAERGRGNLFSRLAASDWRWGTVTARERVAHRLGVIAGLGGDHDSLAELAELATALRTRMLDRWPALGHPPTARPD